MARRRRVTPERRRALLRPGRLLALLCVGLFIALLAYGLVAQAPDTGIDDALARSEPAPAPGFALAVLKGGSLGPVLEPKVSLASADGQVALEEVRGVPLVVNFWASWCVPCREEAPRLERAWRAARGRGVLFVGINMQDLTEDARDFMREFRVSYLNIRDPTNRVARDWEVTGLPETFFVSRRGEVVGHVIGVVSAEQLREGITAARSGRPARARSGGARRSTR